MLTSFTVRNFRCFAELTVEPLARVNLITGQNNTGKTALLEALFLHLGPNNPELPGRIETIRGVVGPGTAEAADLWGWLFPAKRTEEGIHLESTDHQGTHRTLSIRLEDSYRQPVTSVSGREREGDDPATRAPAALSTAPTMKELVLAYRDSTGLEGTSRARIIAAEDGAEVRGERAPLPPVPLAVLLGPRSHRSSEGLEGFTRAVERGFEPFLLESLRCFDPRLRRLMLLQSGGRPELRGDVGIGLPVPLALMGSGLQRVLLVLLEIIRASGGTVLLDEVENGIHHTMLPAVWKAVRDASERTGTQVVATTHSLECLMAAGEAFGGEAGLDLRLHRLEIIDGTLRCISYGPEVFRFAMERGFEVR